MHNRSGPDSASANPLSPPGSPLLQPPKLIRPEDAIAAFNRANLEGSDKGTPGHNYDIMYGPFLAPFLDKPVQVLEIGVENGRGH